jgi:hypothetical protein
VPRCRVRCPRGSGRFGPDGRKARSHDPANKKTAPARGKPKAGTVEVDNARTQLDTNDTRSLRGVSGNARLSGQCYTFVTPPPFRRTECDGHHTALLRRNALTGLIFRVVVTNASRGSRRQAVGDAGISGVPRNVSGDFCLVPRCENKDAKLSICSLAPYQNEMLMPHCRHDFGGSSRSWALFEAMLFESRRLTIADPDSLEPHGA